MIEKKISMVRQVKEYTIKELSKHIERIIEAEINSVYMPHSIISVHDKGDFYYGTVSGFKEFMNYLSKIGFYSCLSLHKNESGLFVLNCEISNSLDRVNAKGSADEVLFSINELSI